MVVRARHGSRPAVELHLRFFRRCGSQSPTSPSLCRGIRYSVHCTLYQAMLALRGHCITYRKVGRSDQERVYFLDRRDVINAVHRFRVFKSGGQGRFHPSRV
jgi:hypothetical protein